MSTSSAERDEARAEVKRWSDKLDKLTPSAPEYAEYSKRLDQANANYLALIDPATSQSAAAPAGN